MLGQSAHYDRQTIATGDGDDDDGVNGDDDDGDGDGDDDDDDDDKIFPGGLEKTCPSVKTHAIFHFPPHLQNNN